MYASPYTGYGLGYTGYSNGYTGYSPTYSNYTSPSYNRYREFSNARYGDVSIYPTPVNYSRGNISRGYSLPPTGLENGRTSRQRTVFRMDRSDRITSAESSSSNRHIRLKSPSIPRERTRDELIDSIIHTRTREHRVMPGFKSTSDFEERRCLRVDCDKVYNGIIVGNGETIQNIDYLKGIGVTHVLNTAEQHVSVNPGRYSCSNIKYYGFHVDDLPNANISRYFHRTTDFIDKAVNSGGLVVVNCVMGWSRSATVVAAYLMMKHKMTATRALETIRQSRPIRPNAGFLQQLADLENTLSKRVAW